MLKALMGLGMLGIATRSRRYPSGGVYAFDEDGRMSEDLYAWISAMNNTTYYTRAERESEKDRAAALAYDRALPESWTMSELEAQFYATQPKALREKDRLNRRDSRWLERRRP
jgi:hypothetical protein